RANLGKMQLRVSYDNMGNCGGMGMAVQRDEMQILDLISDSIIVRDMAGHILVWNEASENLYGIHKNLALGRQIQDLIQMEYPSTPAALDEELAIAGRWQGELRRRVPGGQAISLRVTWLLE